MYTGNIERISRNGRELRGGDTNWNVNRRVWTQFRIETPTSLLRSNDVDGIQMLKRKIEMLPVCAENFYTHDEKKAIIAEKLTPSSERISTAQYACGWHGVLSTLLAGTRSSTDDDCIDNDDDDDDDESCSRCCHLALLKDHENTILCEIMAFVGNPYLNHVRLTIPSPFIGDTTPFGMMRFTKGRDGENYHHREFLLERGIRHHVEKRMMKQQQLQQDGLVSFCKCGHVEFPPPNDRDVNMMPFRLGDIDSLPDDLKCYYEMIEACPYVKEEIDNIAFLTVQESSHIHQGETQRRGGIHIESPGVFSDYNTNTGKCTTPRCQFHPAIEHHWGMGVFIDADRYEGGIYIASNQAGTTKVWDALVDSSIPGIVERGGACDHLRHWIGEGTTLDAGDLVWLTDRTPHEACRQPQTGPRQFFRLVMPAVSHWYADHSTPNPLVPSLPSHIKVIHGDKFKKHGIIVNKQKT
jgi:hypothetical protein